MENIEQNNKYFRAKDRVAALKKFYAKVVSGLFSIGIVAAINYYIDEWAYPWFLWVVFGVGIGLFFRAAKLFNLNPFMGKDWEEQKIKKLMEEEEKRERWR